MVIVGYSWVFRGWLLGFGIGEFEPAVGGKHLWDDYSGERSDFWRMYTSNESEEQRPIIIIVKNETFERYIAISAINQLEREPMSYSMNTVFIFQRLCPHKNW